MQRERCEPGLCGGERAPYKLVPEQALEFYTPSAALVACVLDRHHWQPDTLLAALLGRANNGEKV
jgi:hypothetical protein